MKRTICLQWTDRNGYRNVRKYTVAEAQERLKYLEGAEARTAQMAPTDAGMVRDSYQKEEALLRKALA